VLPNLHSKYNGSYVSKEVHIIMKMCIMGQYNKALNINKKKCENAGRLAIKSPFHILCGATDFLIKKKNLKLM
jgi:hypothetical protein